MADEDDKTENGGDGAPKKTGKKGLIIGVVLALFLGGGGFFAVYSGLLLGEDHAEADTEANAPVPDLAPVAFVPLDPLVISLGRMAENRHLRFQAQLEVDPKYLDDVTTLIPRVMDILNSYLRAVSVTDLENPAALVSLRAQMLRRVQLVTGEGRVRDLLVMEFVLN
ncbi:flagellar basal body-associated FliL family protein [Maritimibacter sp. UBA3975]|uniref:flagellar basal body-associated FliL family protein n=1 Tax=Maritimibacter sp. UBA3975 TaxID=1946833 RepID=UPI000C094377|nr:flagellar basal body-associated FliL family protein [Maritimibacter sp. UBA3975]MAM61861.1 flagellar basal body protein FliL [Maritimibacter sp.]|tara:strand:+ start:21701 stop:22201 length:501 start_codon:yes stop_codon:yes gene_type:complete